MILMVFRGKKKYVIITIIILTLSILLFYNRNRREELYSQSEFFMDTLVTIKVKDKPGAKKAVDRSFTVMKEWSAKLDRYNEHSVVNTVNRNGVNGVRVSDEIMSLFVKAERYYRLSGGAFDITVAPLLDIWGFGKQEQRVPKAELIAQTLANINFQKMVVNYSKNLIYLEEDMKIDLGGMAKGFVVDRGIKSLQEDGIKSAFINAGGNIKVLGPKYKNRPWNIGIRKPRKKGEIFRDHIIGLKKGSVATSGDYERYFIEDGKRYSHLIDPRTGFPVRGMQSVTIYAPDALTADILSTAVLIMGWNEGQMLINSLPEIEGFMVENEDNIWFSKGFRELEVDQ